MSATEVSALIAALRDGTVTLDEAADRFRRRIWQPTRPGVALTAQERAAQRDPGGDVPGSFDEVTVAYDRGDLTAEQYDVLSEAVAEAINAQARRGSLGDS
jgi:hypothetical protein